MAHAILRPWQYTAALLLFSAVAACAPGAAPEAVGGPPPTPRAVQVERELGPGKYDLYDGRVGLPELSSYRATLTLSFDGKQGGQAAQWTRTYDYRSSKEPALRLWTLETTEPSIEGQPVGRAEASGADYEIFADGYCVARAQDPSGSVVANIEPAGDLPGLLGLELAGHETLDGVEADRYTFDERALLRAGETKSSGELWFSREGGYVLRYLETTTAGEKFFGEGTQGTIKWDYRLTEINQPQTVELPPDCPPGLVDAPLMPDAANVRSDPGTLEYESASSLADVVAFYEEQLPALGWVDPGSLNIVPEGVSPEDYQQMMEMAKAFGLNQPAAQTAPDDKPMLVFDREGARLSVLITVEGSTTTVMLSLSRAPARAAPP